MAETSIITAPAGPAPVAALRYARDVLRQHQGGDDRIELNSVASDQLLAVIRRAVLRHWNQVCYELLDCNCGRCVMCGEPVANDRTPADRFDDEFTDDDHLPSGCSACGGALHADAQDDGCPHDDPACEGANGDRHDDCSTFAERERAA